MTWNRPKRLAIVLFALVNLLFMQLSLASYACPVAASGLEKAQMGNMNASGMPCAEAMAWADDNVQPNLCAAHCKADPSTSDRPELPAIAALVAPAGDYGMLLRISLPPGGTPFEAPLLARGTVPSLAVRHCCFRL